MKKIIKIVVYRLSSDMGIRMIVDCQRCVMGNAECPLMPTAFWTIKYVRDYGGYMMVPYCCLVAADLIARMFGPWKKGRS